MRKIEAMHARFGILPDKRCEDCANLIKGEYHGMRLRKCTVYGATHSEASDWRKKYVACGMYNREWNGRRIIEIHKRDLKNERQVDRIEPIEGQIEMEGL